MELQSRHSLHVLAARHPQKGLSQRIRTYPRLITLQDTALSVLTDFDEEPPCTIAEHSAVSDALDQLFLAAGRALLVTRDTQVIGIVTADQLRDRRAQDEMTHRTCTVAEVMTEASDLPMMDWRTMLACRVGDLLEIFEATGYAHLVVVEANDFGGGRVRGLIHRSRLATRLRDSSAGADTT